MSSKIVENNDSKCRICLIESNNEVYSLFSENAFVKNCLTNADLIMECSSVQVLKNDGLPQNVCAFCHNKLTEFYKFKKLCETSDHFLQATKVKDEIQINKDDEIDDDEYYEPLPLENEFLENTKRCCSKTFSQLEYLNHIKSHYLTNFKKRISKKVKSKMKCCVDLKVVYPKRTTVSFPCPVCKKVFKDSQIMKEHQKRHECPYCSTTVENIKVHLTTKHELELDPFQKVHTKCPICNQHYINLELHHRDKHAESYKCPTCSKSFANSRGLVKHTRRGHKTTIISKKSKHLCPYCGRCFTEGGNLTAHIRIHTGEKPYICEFCKKTFAQWSSLRSHKVVHTGEKNYACEICGKAFARLIALRKHLVSHSEECKFPCEICGRKFKHSRSVKEHMVIHTGVKNFVCETCNKAFGFRKNLVVHRRMHTGDKPFKCEYCSSAFSQRHCLRSHIRTHHKTFESGLKK